MNELIRIAEYLCEICKNIRQLELNESQHNDKISSSKNGLGLYSDIHNCKDGILGVNNLFIDNNYAIRSFEPQELPPVRPTPKFAIPGVSTSIIGTKRYKKLYVTYLDPDFNIQLVLKDDSLMTTMYFGINEQDCTTPIQSITSDLGGVTLSLFETDISYSPTLEKWLHILVNCTEILPPTRFGLLIETIRYILSLHDKEPTKFDIRLIRTILASHEIYFKSTSDPDRFDNIAVQLSSKLSVVDTAFLMDLLGYLELHPAVPLLEYIKTYHRSLVYLIYLFLLFEREGFIIIDRPGIVDL